MSWQSKNDKNITSTFFTNKSWKNRKKTVCRVMKITLKEIQKNWCMVLVHLDVIFCAKIVFSQKASSCYIMNFFSKFNFFIISCNFFSGYAFYFLFHVFYSKCKFSYLTYMLNTSYKMLLIGKRSFEISSLT